LFQPGPSTVPATSKKRALDREGVEWLGRNPNATPAQFESYLRALYQRPDLVQRFPLGFE